MKGKSTLWQMSMESPLHYLMDFLLLLQYEITVHVNCYIL